MRVALVGVRFRINPSPATAALPPGPVPWPKARTVSTARRYFVAVNQYRGASSSGFANTWEVYECADAAHQRRVLSEGLPVSDECHPDTRKPSVTTMGVRACTPAERREAKRDEELHGYSIPDMTYGHPDYDDDDDYDD